MVAIELILSLHDFVIERDGGSKGLLNEGTLDHLIDGCAYHYDPIYQAAYLLHGIATMHPFIDGNKRTAFLAAFVTLFRQGMNIDASNDDVSEFVLSVARGEKTELDVRKWIRDHLTY
ncbi:MAG: type II toxin-antitoxin system death-on-curing family toxin [Methanomicrobiales archaeon]|jgi:death-on-curing protein|nr:type II toxin-antitoxin system death-on-curing family toxin [Methanomicrobiales archaeon]